MSSEFTEMISIEITDGKCKLPEPFFFLYFNYIVIFLINLLDVQRALSVNNENNPSINYEKKKMLVVYFYLIISMCFWRMLVKCKEQREIKSDKILSTQFDSFERKSLHLSVCDLILYLCS